MSRPTEFTDNQLLVLIRDENVAAFKQLYLRYFPVLCRSGFRKIQDKSVIEEIVQDIFMDIWRQRQTLDPAKEIGALLNALLRNKVLHEWRANAIRAKHVAVFSMLKEQDTEESLSEHFDANEIQERLTAAITNLSPKCRQVFELSRYEHLSHREISERMTISIKTVEKHIGKALKILKLELKELHLTILFMVSWLFF